jgi:hypothetical protein
VLSEEGVSFQRPKTFKASNDPDFEAKQRRGAELYAIADGHAEPGPDDPDVVICLDEFGPLNLPAASRPPVGSARRLSRRASAAATRDLHPPARRPPPAGRL